MKKSNNQGRKSTGGRPFKYDRTFMRQVAWAYIAGNESLSQVAQRFNVSVDQVRSWRSKFSSDLGSPTPVAVPMTEQEQQQLAALKKQNEELAKRLEQANLQIFGLQTMIDVAEQTLKIDIRKKSGPKQSKK